MAVERVLGVEIVYHLPAVGRSDFFLCASLEQAAGRKYQVGSARLAAAGPQPREQQDSQVNSRQRVDL